MASNNNPLFDWDLTVAMLSKLLKQPGILKKFAAYVKPELLFYGQEVDPQVKGLRLLFRVLLELDTEKRLQEVLGNGDKNAIYAFALEIKKLPDGDAKDEALKICDRIKTDKQLAIIAESEPCLNQFINYLKAMTIRDWSKEFSEPYRQGKIVNATKLIKDLVTRLDKINVRTFETLNPDDLYSNFANPNIGLNNFKLGIKAIDGKHGFCEPGTLTIFMAPPGGGKSMMVTTLVGNAIAQRRRTCITVVEDKRRTFEPRLLAAMTGIPIRKLKNDFMALTGPEIEIFNKSVKMIKDYLHVDYIYGESIEMIHARKIEIDEIARASGEEPFDIDILDYSMHVAQTSGGTDKTHEKLMSAYKMRKDFCLKYNKVAFDFLQVNRAGAAKAKGGADMLEMTDIAGAFDIARVGDNIISINRSDFDKTNNIAHFWITKGRDSDAVALHPIIVPTEFHIGRYNMAKAYMGHDEPPPDTDEDNDATTIFKKITETV